MHIAGGGGGGGGGLSRSASSVGPRTPRTPHTPLGPSDNASVDSNPMPTIYRCRAPIASLDCMSDDFSANSQPMLDQVADGAVTRHLPSYLGNQNTMPPVITPGLRYRNLGKSGMRVPNVGLGIWTLMNEDCAEEVVMTAIENGIYLFDLSEAHCAKGEAELGRILKKRNVKRHSVNIITKVYWSTKSEEKGLSRKHIIESVQASMARLQTDYIDVVLLHKVDPVCPMEEMVRAMNFLIDKGWIMYWGTARWSPSEIMEAYSNCRQFNCVTPIVEQTEYHMFCREKTELYLPELYHKIGVGTMVWSAITTGKGMGREEVTGLFAKSRFNRKYSTFSWCEEDMAAGGNEARSRQGSKEQVAVEDSRTYGDKLRDLGNLANSLNCTLGQLAVAWCLKNETINCLLLGAGSVEQFKENIHALQIVPQLTSTVILEIERIIANKPTRPAMVSTLVLRSQQNQARLDLTDFYTEVREGRNGSVTIAGATRHSLSVHSSGVTPSGPGAGVGAGAGAGASSPKAEADGDVEAGIPAKEGGARGFCEIQ